MGKYIIQCFSNVTYHMCVFDMVCVGMCKCDHISFSCKPENNEYVCKSIGIKAAVS